MASFFEDLTGVGPMDTPRAKGFASVRSWWLPQMPKAGAGFIKNTLGLIAGPAFLAYSAHEGYQTGGTWGAAKAVSRDLSMAYIWGATVKPMLPYIAGGAAVAGVAAYAAGIRPMHLARPMVKKHMLRHIGLEMGSPNIDPYGTGATMRQRSLMAIQNSRLGNARAGLGNEAFLLQQSYWR